MVEKLLASRFIVDNSVLNVTNPQPDFFMEQAALHNVMESMPDKDKHFKWVPQKVMNAYYDYPSICRKDLKDQYPVFEKGDLVLHFPGHSSASWLPNFLSDWLDKAVGFDDVELI